MRRVYAPRDTARAGPRAAIIPGMPWDDDDDWVGEPPEGRHTRDRAKPDFWRSQRPPGLIVGAFAVVAIVLLVVLLLA
jgi:hypothetical protein